MSAYIDSIRRAPKTLTEIEQRLLLKTTGQHRAGFRDHVIFSLALGTALREHEILALDVGDVFDDAGKARRVYIYAYSRAATRTQPQRK
jgi:integrase